MDMSLRSILLLLACSLIALSACDSDSEPTPDQAGDGDGDPGDGDGDPGDGDGDDYSCFADGDSTIPFDCRCTPEGEACFSDCVLPPDADACDDAGASDDDGGVDACVPEAVTCNDVCGVGRCAENECGGSTWLYGDTYDCARPSEYSGTEPARCDEPIRFEHIFGDHFENLPVTCCCK